MLTAKGLLSYDLSINTMRNLSMMGKETKSGNWLEKCKRMGKDEYPFIE